jgi:hypothetical protein
MNCKIPVRTSSAGDAVQLLLRFSFGGRCGNDVVVLRGVSIEHRPREGLVGCDSVTDSLEKFSD